MRLLNKLLGKEKPEIEKFSEDNYINKFGSIRSENVYSQIIFSNSQT